MAALTKTVEENRDSVVKAVSEDILEESVFTTIVQSIEVLYIINLYIEKNGIGTLLILLFEKIIYF